MPGLPLTVLDHNLVHGNALVGIGTIDEVRAWFEKHSTKMFPVDADNLLGPAKQPLTACEARRRVNQGCGRGA